MSDKIDRNELIDYFCQEDCCFNPKDCAIFPCDEIEIIKSAPSVQPDVPDTNVGELISRQAVIAEFDCCELTPDGGIDVNYALDFIKALPSAQPRKGKWIYGEHDVAMCDGYRCNKCGFFVPWDYQHKFIDFIKDYNYCPACGADMRGRGDSDGNH